MNLQETVDLQVSVTIDSSLGRCNWTMNPQVTVNSLLNARN